ncbi:MAG: sugar transferase [Bacteroidales bacterium]|nr:sugar transferase [Bacteroidales bacterium]
MSTKNRLKKKTFTLIYILLDFAAAVLAWCCFFSLRKWKEASYFHLPQVWNSILGDYKFYIGITLIPLCWIVLYAFCGTYNHVWKKSRIKELSNTFTTILFGSLILFFVVILDDYIIDYTDYIKLYLLLFCLQFGLTALTRITFITILKKQVYKGLITFNTIMIGNYDLCLDLLKTLQKKAKFTGARFVGYVSMNVAPDNENSNMLPLLGDYTSLSQIIHDENIEEVIVAVKNNKLEVFDKVVPQLISSQVLLKIIPSIEDHLLRTVKDTSILDEPFIQINMGFRPQWQIVIKRITDILFSAAFLIVCSPIYLILAIGVKRSSPGSIFYLQERIGKGGKPFYIIKFRSMYENAEINGPQLSKKDDARITKFGLFLRKTHLDEIPQFFNVLKGNMSLVGHRPERQYYMDQIIQKAPYYKLLLMEKPGITSWGQVCYGYAENVDEMIERLRYDLMYIENMSISLDIKIIIHTILCVFKRNGK